MQIKTLLNYTTKFKSFVFQDPRLCRDLNRLLIPVVPGKTAVQYVQDVVALVLCITI